MRNSAPRTEIGDCDLGTVFIHSFGGTPVGGKLTNFKYEVRAGNHTVATESTYAGAEAVANALCGIEPEPEADGLAPQSVPKTKVKAKAK